MKTGDFVPNDPRLTEAVEALRQHGSISAAARALGIARTTLQSRLMAARAQGLLAHEDPAIESAMAAVKTQMVPALAWIKTEPDEDGVSHSVLLKPAPTETPDLIERLRLAFDDLADAPEVPAPETVMGKLLTLYPLFDAHIGMHAWGRETGAADYDLKLAEKDAIQALASVMHLSPPSAEGVLLVGGDYLHADDQSNQTPASKHILDVDGRHHKVLEVGLRILISAIDRLRSKHQRLTVQVLRGNHDPHAHLVMTFALEQRYRSTKDVEILRSPRDLYMRQWGQTAIFAHHGDKAKPERFSLYLSDICPFWSQTRHRYALTGHVHHDNAKDIGPLRWESLRAFCPPDAWAASMGFGARRALQALTFHTEDGLVLRAMDPIERRG